jgi:hypothetical protein
MDRVYVGLDIMEGEPMKTDKIVVDLNKLTQGSGEQCKVVLIGSYFDSEKHRA